MPSRSTTRLRVAPVRMVGAMIGVMVGAVSLALIGCPSFDGFVGGSADAGPPEAAPLDATQDSPLDTAQADGGQPDGRTDSGPMHMGYLSLADAARFCAKALTCPNLAKSTQHSIGVPVDGSNYSACVSWLAGQLPPGRIGLPQADALLSCAENAGTCAAANACMWWEVVSPTDLRCAGVDAGADAGTVGSCSPSGDAIYYCAQAPPYVWHCTSEVYYPGSTCLFDDAGGGGYACEVATGCGSVPGSGQCMGNVVSYCTGGNHIAAYDCSVLGLPCGFDPNAMVYDCLSNGMESFCPDMSAPPTCAGNVVSLCAGSFQGGIDCGTLGGTCDATGTPRCKMPTDTCSPSDANSNTCTGDTISLCVSGRPVTLDCTSIGLHCLAAGNGLTPHCG
jgi:hypothetical protein